VAVPPWPGEDDVCVQCGFDYAAASPNGVADLVRTAVHDLGVAVGRATEAQLRARDEDGSWSAIEYLCHLRDVFVTTTIRLYRARTEDHPQVDPMLNDLRAARFDYASAGERATLGDLDRSVEGCCAEIGRIRDLDRTVVRRPGEERTARWLVRNALHEGVHHLRDVRRLLSNGDADKITTGLHLHS
jgi:hypothetical protein